MGWGRCATDGGRTSFAGPICRLPIDTNIPHSLHGMFVKGLVFEDEDILRAYKVRPLSKTQSCLGWTQGILLSQVAAALDKRGWNKVDSGLKTFAGEL
jgi:hypothetical protein